MDEDLLELGEIVTELGKDFVADWAVQAAASVAVGAVAGSIVPGAGNAAGAAVGAVVGTINAGRKLAKAGKYIKLGTKLYKVSTKLYKKSALAKTIQPKLLEVTAKGKNSANKILNTKLENFTPSGNNIFAGANKGVKIDAKSVNKKPITEALNNIGENIKKLGDDLCDAVKKASEESRQLMEKIEKEKKILEQTKKILEKDAKSRQFFSKLNIKA